MKRLLDVFYPIFKAFMPKSTYRYLAVGGICFLTNFCIFHFSYYCIYTKLPLPPEQVYPHVLSILTSFSITVFIGFILNAKFVFTDSILGMKEQRFRYVGSTIVATIVSIILMHLFSVCLKMNLTISFLMNILIIQTANFYIQKYFSFRSRE